MLVYDKNKTEEIDSKSEDHAYDSLTYGLYYLTQGGMSIARPKLPGKDYKEGYLVENDRLQYNVDIEKMLKLNNKPETDWRYR